ncbi:MAG: VCBS repeat-containing protein [Planctomycetales bacterium]|nr:VCBS repeat-containing protein [Planctomycetales bacterium]
MARKHKTSRRTHDSNAALGKTLTPDATAQAIKQRRWMICVVSVATLLTLVVAFRSRSQHDVTVTPAIENAAPQFTPVAAEAATSTTVSPALPAESATNVRADTELTTTRTRAYDELLNASVDPSRDGWISEQLAEAATEQLNQLLAQVQHDRLDTTAIATLLTSDFACTPLRPAPLTRLYRDDMVLAEVAAAKTLQTPPTQRGVSGLQQSLATLRARIPPDAVFQTKAKLVAMQIQDKRLAARAHIELDALPPQARAQIRTNWDCLWGLIPAAEPNGLPRLQLSAIRVADFQESIARETDVDWFIESTAAVIGHNRVVPEQLAFGLDDWLKQIERTHRMHVFMACGVAVGDANGDGMDDLYVCQPGGLPNRLFVQNRDGTADEVSWRARVDWLDSTSSALFVDLDNDGDQDLVLATLSGLVILQNDGAARFNLVGTLPTDGADMQSLTAADYDNDGDVDLFVCLNFPKASAQREGDGAFTYHDANDGAQNHLFRNEWTADHTWKFTDVTEASGIGQDNHRHSLAASWEDYDNDGDQDLYVANDYGQNCLYRNDGGTFRNVAASVGVVDQGSGMSVSWSDINNDGRMDLYVGNMFSSAGSRITTQPGFRPGIADATRSILRRFAKGNSLFLNRPDGNFQDVGGQAGVEMARWAWSSLFFDMNNSGFEDILVANGYISTDDTGDL